MNWPNWPASGRLVVASDPPYGQDGRCVRLSIPPLIEKLGEVRAFVGAICLDSSFDQARTYDICLAVSEAVANAVEHATAEGDIEIVVWSTADRVIVEITNPGGFRPKAEPKSEQHPRGLGLPLMLSLADLVNVSRLSYGKTLVSLTFFRSVVTGNEITDDSVPSTGRHETEHFTAATALVAAARREERAEREISLPEEAQRARDEDLSRNLSDVGRLRFFEQPSWIVIAVGAVVQVAVLWGVDRLGSPSHYLGVPGAAAALIGVVASLLAGPVAGTTVALAGGAAYFAFLTDYGTTVDRPAVVASVLLWTLAAALAGLAADRVRRNASARERLLSLALGKQESLAESLNVANRGLQSQNELLAAREEELLSQAEELVRLGELNERLYQEQKSIAERLQFSLLDLPGHLRGVTFAHVYRSATEEATVGGDFYDVFEAAGGRIGILIGDVCGHGVEAARTATRVKDTVYAFSHSLHQPHEVVRETNLLLYEKRISGFVTAFLGFLDLDTGRLDYSSAGHPPPVIVDGDSGREYLEIHSFPLGLFDDSTYETRTTRLGEDALLVLYTDGITDARCERAFFGEEGLLDSLRRHSSDDLDALPSAILGDVLAFSGGELRDDVALLMLRLSHSAAATVTTSSMTGLGDCD
jgi:serine phosphatase RsbU (regulator of sigma subunit)/anti-sigma regulatory factor (Ser/Thr protein kinase)